MIRTIGPARLGFAAALLALLLGPLALGFHTAHAQVGPDTASFYGQNLSEGDAVTASIGDTECGSATATAEGWLIEVGPGDCAPENGDTVSFTVNGDAAEQTATWSAGGVAEVSLTVAAMPEPTPEPTAEPTAMPETPEEPETGNAGLVGTAGSSSLLALALGILAVAGIAGARVATRRVS